jgi:Mg/Co/Ni transporter MgtE
VSPADKAAIFERASVAERQSILERANAVDQVALLGRATPEERVAMFGRCTPEERSSILAKANVTQADFERMNVQQRAEALDRLTGGLAAVYQRATPAERAEMLGRSTPEERVAMFGRMDPAERASVLEKANVTQADFERMNVQQRAETLDRLTGGLAAVYQRATPAERVELLGRCDVNERTAILGRATPQQKAELLGRAPEVERAQVFERALASERTSFSMEKSNALERTNVEASKN